MFARSSRRPVRQGGERFLQRIGGIARPHDMLASEFKHPLIRNAAYEALLKSRAQRPTSTGSPHDR
jgi:hypothetical protein